MEKIIKTLYFRDKITDFILISIIPFIIGFLISWSFFAKPLTEDQYLECEKVARDVYSQEGNFLIEIPENFNVTISKTSIKVEPSSSMSGSGDVVAKLKNGELVITRHSGIGLRIFGSIVIGLLFGVITFAIFSSIVIKVGKRKFGV